MEKYFLKALDFDVKLSYLHGINKQEKQMKKNNETRFTEKLKQYGFEKKPKTEDGLQMWELDPSKLRKKEDKKNA